MRELALQLATAAQEAGDSGGKDVALHLFGHDLTGVAAAVPLIAGVIGIAGGVWAAVRFVRGWLRPLGLVALSWQTKTDPDERPATHIAAWINNRTRRAQTPTIRVVVDPGRWKRLLPGWHRRLSSAGELQTTPKELHLAADDGWKRVRLVVVHGGESHPPILVVAWIGFRCVAETPKPTAAAIG